MPNSPRRRRPLSREVDFEDTIQPAGDVLRWSGRAWWPIRRPWWLGLALAPLNVAIAVVVTAAWLAVLALWLVYAVLSWIGWVLGNS